MLESWAAYGLYSPHYMYVIRSLVIFALSFPQLIAGSQIYLYVVIASYGNSQRRDHDRYNQVYDPTQPITENVPLNNQNDPWDSRPSAESNRSRSGPNTAQYQHLRQFSTASASDILNQHHQQPDDSLSNDYGYQSSHYTIPQEKPLERGYSTTRPPLPTSRSNDGYYTDPSYQDRPTHSGGLI